MTNKIRLCNYEDISTFTINGKTMWDYIYEDYELLDLFLECFCPEMTIRSGGVDNCTIYESDSTYVKDAEFDSDFYYLTLTSDTEVEVNLFYKGKEIYDSSNYKSSPSPVLEMLKCVSEVLNLKCEFYYEWEDVVIQRNSKEVKI